MRRNTGIFLAAVVAGGFAVRSGCASSSQAAPDQRIAQHFGAICKIADAHVESPHAGAQKLFRYLGDHTPEILHDWGELLVLIERIDDDQQHDARARLASQRFDAVLDPCTEPMTEFLNAIENDPEASRLAERNFKRLERTLDILFGGQLQRSVIGATWARLLPVR